MTNEKIDAICEQAVTTWGAGHQAIKTCEEMAELIVALAKRINDSPIEDEAIVDELADVSICLRQMILYFGVEDVVERIDYKIERLALAIENNSGAI